MSCPADKPLSSPDEDLLRSFTEASQLLLQFGHLADEARKLARTESISSHELRFPQIVVAGDQSAGKSTFVNALLGMPVMFTGDFKATRRPVSLRIDRDDSLSEAVFSIRDPENPLNNKDDIPLDKIQECMKACFPENEHDISSTELLLTSRSPYGYTLHVTDLPGFTATGAEDGRDPEDTAVREIFDRTIRQMSRNSPLIVVFVLSASDLGKITNQRTPFTALRVRNEASENISFVFVVNKAGTLMDQTARDNFFHSLRDPRGGIQLLSSALKGEGPDKMFFTEHCGVSSLSSTNPWANRSLLEASEHLLAVAEQMRGQIPDSSIRHQRIGCDKVARYLQYKLLEAARGCTPLITETLRRELLLSKASVEAASLAFSECLISEEKVCIESQALVERFVKCLGSYFPKCSGTRRSGLTVNYGILRRKHPFVSLIGSSEAINSEKMLNELFDRCLSHRELFEQVPSPSPSAGTTKATPPGRQPEANATTPARQPESNDETSLELSKQHVSIAAAYMFTIQETFAAISLHSAPVLTALHLHESITHLERDASYISIVCDLFKCCIASAFRAPIGVLKERLMFLFDAAIDSALSNLKEEGTHGVPEDFLSEFVQPAVRDALAHRLQLCVDALYNCVMHTFEVDSVIGGLYFANAFGSSHKASSKRYETLQTAFEHTFDDTGLEEKSLAYCQKRLRSEMRYFHATRDSGNPVSKQDPRDYQLTVGQLFINARQTLMCKLPSIIEFYLGYPLVHPAESVTGKSGGKFSSMWELVWHVIEQRTTPIAVREFLLDRILPEKEAKEQYLADVKACDAKLTAASQRLEELAREMRTPLSRSAVHVPPL